MQCSKAPPAGCAQTPSPAGAHLGGQSSGTRPANVFRIHDLAVFWVPAGSQRLRATGMEQIEPHASHHACGPPHVQELRAQAKPSVSRMGPTVSKLEGGQMNGSIYLLGALPSAEGSVQQVSVHCLGHFRALRFGPGGGGLHGCAAVCVTTRIMVMA